MLANALNDHEAGIIKAALNALETKGDEAIEPLTTALDSQHTDVRRTAADLLKRKGEPTLESLVEALPINDKEVVENAILGLRVKDHCSNA